MSRLIRWNPTREMMTLREVDYSNGVLTLTVPKAEEVKPKRISIKANANQPAVIEG